MAAPNLISATTINGKTATVTPANTSANSILSNAASSGKALRVNTLIIANADTVARNVTINLYSAAALGGTAFPLLSVVSVPANQSVSVLDKGPIYLEEDRSLGVTAGTASTITVICSYEDIS